MKRSKIFYTPGLISLLGLYPLLVIYPIGEIKIETCIKFFLPSDRKTSEEYSLAYSKYVIYDGIRNKKIIYVNIDDSERGLRNAKKDFIITEIKRLQFTYDTACVLKIGFGKSTTYGDFVWVINQAIIYGFKKYAFVDDCFYLFPNPLPVVE